MLQEEHERRDLFNQIEEQGRCHGLVGRRGAKLVSKLSGWAIGTCYHFHSAVWRTLFRGVLARSYHSSHERNIAGLWTRPIPNFSEPHLRQGTWTKSRLPLNLRFLKYQQFSSEQPISIQRCYNIAE
jgi:hypothetical protein